MANVLSYLNTFPIAATVSKEKTRHAGGRGNMPGSAVSAKWSTVPNSCAVPQGGTPRAVPPRQSAAPAPLDDVRGRRTGGNHTLAAPNKDTAASPSPAGSTTERPPSMRVPVNRGDALNPQDLDPDKPRQFGMLDPIGLRLQTQASWIVACPTVCPAGRPTTSISTLHRPSTNWNPDRVSRSLHITED
ncbi:hypothetical protein KC357_g9139 [Hortaea werneckii]|nr:hypothetical protein KC357_g9139 [Hortaea werneckii]